MLVWRFITKDAGKGQFLSSIYFLPAGLSVRLKHEDGVCRPCGPCEMLNPEQGPPNSQNKCSPALLTFNVLAFPVQRVIPAPLPVSYPTMRCGTLPHCPPPHHTHTHHPPGPAPSLTLRVSQSQCQPDIFCCRPANPANVFLTWSGCNEYFCLFCYKSDCSNE